MKWVTRKTEDIKWNSGNSTFYQVNAVHQSSLDSQRSGWLKKQGGAFKSWHRRWFNLKGGTLYYYAAQDEAKLMGSISLQDNNVIEHAMSAAKPDEFLFEIVPYGEKAKTSQSHDTYLICACSDEERKSWVSALKRVMFADRGGAIFGSSLKVTLQNEIRLRGPHKIPEIVQLCAEFVVNCGLETEGIFRLPGRASLIRELKEKFDQGLRPELHKEEHDVPTIASLLKQYLRDLPEPLIPKIAYEDVMKVVNREIPVNLEEGILKLRDHICDLPMENYNTLQYLCHFLNQVASHSDVNKMTPMNLATVFVHSVIRPEDEDPALLMGTANSRTNCTFLLMEREHDIFTKHYDETESIPVENLLNMPENNLQSAVNDLEISEPIAGTPSSENSIGMDFVHVSNVQSPTADELLGFHDNHFGPMGGLPSPLTPKTIEDRDTLNRRGSRKGRVFPQDMTYGGHADFDTPVYIDSDQLPEGGNSSQSLDVSPRSDPGYETIDDIAANATRTYPPTEENYPPTTQSYPPSPPDTNANSQPFHTEDTSPTNQNSDIHQPGYSHLSNYSSNSQGAKEFKDEDDYSYLPSETSNQKPILRKKPSIDSQSSRISSGVGRPNSEAHKVPPKPRPRTSLTKRRSSGEDPDVNSVYSLPFDSISESERQVELRERSSRLLSKDLDLLCTREDLLVHIEQLKKIIAAQTKELSQVKSQLHKQTKQHELTLKEKDEQLEVEKEARSNAVNRVVSLQSDLQTYITRYGSVISDT